MPFVRHMLLQYCDAWPDNPFRFRVPYNEEFPQALVDEFGAKVQPPPASR